jgi:hypothetical protein
MMIQHHSHMDVVVVGCGVLYVLFVARRFSADGLLKRAMFGCVVCLLAIDVVAKSGEAVARVRAAGGWGMGVSMGVVVLFAVLRLRLSR